MPRPARSRPPNSKESNCTSRTTTGPSTAGRFARIDPAAYLPEAFSLGDRALYLYAPDGLGRSKLAEALSRSSVTKDTVATSRNWNTVARLVELTAPTETTHDGAPA